MSERDSWNDGYFSGVLQSEDSHNLGYDSLVKFDAAARIFSKKVNNMKLSSTEESFFGYVSGYVHGFCSNAHLSRLNFLAENFLNTVEDFAQELHFKPKIFLKKSANTFFKPDLNYFLASSYTS